VPGTSLDRQCGSSQQALHFAAQAVMSGAMDVVIAAGVESMSRVPMFSATILAQNAGLGGPVGPAMTKRYPGIEFSQFIGAEMLVGKHGLTKDQLDQFGYESQLKAIAATESGQFKNELCAVEITTADGKTELHTIDEGIRFNVTLDGVKGVKLLQEGGALSAATSSQICDGSAGVMVVNEAGLKALGVEPLARIHHMTVVGGDPVIMLEAPLPGTERALKKTGLKIDDIDLFEVNEAFASVPLAWLKATGADPARLNVNGGAIALGHPLGGSGAKLMTTLVHALKNRGKRWGLQTMCEGGGMANVTIVERL
jgi:acetyl-CoA C-acetyltransferase